MFEIQRQAEYAQKLLENFGIQANSYNAQFERLAETIDENMAELEALRTEHGTALKEFDSILIQNDSLETRLLTLQTERDMRVSLDEQHKIHMLKADTADAYRRAERMEQTTVAIIAKWQNRVAEMQRHVEIVQQTANEELMTQLIAKHMASIEEKNAQIISLTKQKVQIESKLQSAHDEDDVKLLQEELSALISDYETVVSGRVTKIKEMIDALKLVAQGNEDLVHVTEDIQRVKNAIDLAKKDIAKKQLVQIQIQDEIIEI